MPSKRGGDSSGGGLPKKARKAICLKTKLKILRELDEGVQSCFMQVLSFSKTFSYSSTVQY